jgi:hypothetical protein
MTIEEAWMFWMKTSRSTTEPPTETDFDVIKKSSHWAAFEAGWHAANSNNEVWDQAYWVGVEAGKETERYECAKICDERERANLYGVRECAEAIRARNT